MVKGTVVPPALPRQPPSLWKGARKAYAPVAASVIVQQAPDQVSDGNGHVDPQRVVTAPGYNSRLDKFCIKAPRARVVQCTALQGSTHRQVSAAKEPSVREFQFAEACYATFPPLPDDAFSVDPPEWKGIKIVTYARQSPLPQLPWRSPYLGTHASFWFLCSTGLAVHSLP